MAGKPDSKRGRVRARFEDKGEKEAIALGKSLGIPDSRVRRWIKKWAPKTYEPSVPLVVRPPKKGLVHFVDRPDCFGRVTKKGSKQSEVAWLNGNVTTVNNEWIKPVETGE